MESIRYYSEADMKEMVKDMYKKEVKAFNNELRKDTVEMIVQRILAVLLIVISSWIDLTLLKLLLFCISVYVIVIPFSILNKFKNIFSKNEYFFLNLR